MRRVALPIIFGFVLSLASAIYGRELNWPDYYHIEYGLPLAWLVRTLSTIAGPTDRYSFQIIRFALDWIFWIALGTMLLLIALRQKKRKP